MRDLRQSLAGLSTCQDEVDLSLSTLVKDTIAIIDHVTKTDPEEKVVIAGHRYHCPGR